MPGRTEGEIRQIVAGFVRSAYYSETAFGFLGEPIGGGRFNFASARLGYVKARLIQNDQVTAIIDVLNTKAPLDPRIRLIIGKNRSGEWEVVEVDATYIAQFLDGRPGMGTGPHSHRLGYGLEDYLEPRRFEPGLVRVYDQTMTVYVLPYSYLNSVGDPAYFGGDTLDLTAYRPITPGQWCWAKVGIDPVTGDLMVETGTTAASIDLLTAADLYAIPFTGIPLAGVKLRAGMSAINEEIYFVDCRVWYGGGGSSASTFDASAIVSGVLDAARIPDYGMVKVDAADAPAYLEDQVIAGTNITVTKVSGQIEIAAASGSGEANTGVNVGTGAGVFRDKTGVNLNFKTLKAGSAKISITGSADEVAVDLGTVAYSDITGSLPAHTHAAGDITSGTLALARGGTGANLSATGGANQIVKQSTVGGALSVGTLSASEIPNLDANKITSGTLNDARIPNLAASKITSGQLALARGGTGADLSATGGTGQVVKQSSAGGALSVGALSASEIPNLDANKINSGTLPEARGGTNQATYATGDILYASAANTLSKRAIGSVGQVLKVLSGGVPGWANESGGGGGSADYVRLSHTVSAGTSGGSTSSGAWRTRPINTEDEDTSGICSLASNEFTLDAGTYEINASSILYGSNDQHQHRLYDVTNAAAILYGETHRGTTNISQSGVLRGRFTLTSSTILRLEYRVTTSIATNGLGYGVQSWENNVFAIIELWRIAT